MTQHRRRLNRAAAEELLDGRSARTDAIAEILSAARAGADPHEIRGIDAALAAFATATPDSPTAAAIEPERRTPVLKRLLTAKVIGVGIGAVALSGVALAAGTGSLPSPLSHSDHAATAASNHVPRALPSGGSSSSSESSDDSSSAAATSSSAAESSSSGVSSSNSTSATNTPSPSLVGLCQSWLSRPHEHGKADTNPAFTVLTTAAGSKDVTTVDAFCTAMLATAHPTHPTHPATPTDSSHPTHPAHPTNPASTHTPQANPSPSGSSHHGKPTGVPPRN